MYYDYCIEYKYAMNYSLYISFNTDLPKEFPYLF